MTSLSAASTDLNASEAQPSGVAGGVDRSWQSILQLPLSPMRIRFIHFRSLYDQWVQGSLRDEESLSELVQKYGLEPQAATFSYWVDAIRAEIPASEEYREFRRLFDEEAKKAAFAIERGTTEGTPEGSPQPNDRWRRTLWGVAMLFAEKKATQAQPHPSKEEFEAAKAAKQKIEIPPIASIKPIQEAVATTPEMQWQLDQFVKRTNESQRGIGHAGKGIAPATIQYGPMRSWFFNAKKSENPNLKTDLINLDLQMTLIVGDFVDTIFQHEQEHQEKSVVYPSCVEDHRRLAKEAEDKLKELTKQGKGIKVGKEGIKNFDSGSEVEKLVRQKILHNYLFGLKQPVWNCAEDNMCDQGVSNLSIPERKNPVYAFDMSHGINTTTVIARGIGPGMIGINPPETEQDKESPAYQLSKIQNAILFAFYIRNKLVADSAEGLEKLKIDIAVIKDVDHPNATSEQAYRSMRNLCDAIAEAQPVPNDRKRLNPAAYKAFCAKKCDERNQIIDELFRRFVDPTIEKMKQEFEEKNLEEQIEELKEQMKQRGQKGQGQGQGQGEGEGSGEGIPYESEDGEGEGEGEGKQGEIPSDPSLGDKPGQGQGKGTTEKDGSGGKSWGDAERDAEKERPNSDGKGKPSGEGKERGPMKQRSQTPGGGGVGQGGDPLKELQLGDGRSWAQLREDPKYQEAVDHVAERLESISKKFPSIVIRREQNSTLLPTQAGAMGDLAGRIDKDALFDLEIARHTGDMSMSDLQTFRDDIEEKIASPGDLFLAIDASGSMGSGVGSRLEAAMKSAAILHDAATRAGYGVYITVWGNDFPYMITSPGLPDEVTVGQFDTVLGAALTGTHVSGLHLGTNLDGAIANVFGQVAQHREEHTLYQDENEPSDLPKRKRPRGPVHVLFLTDGEVGNQAEFIDKALEGKQGITFDAALTEGDDRSMREIMQRVPNHGSKKSIVVDIKDSKNIPQQMVRWAEERYERVLDQVASNGGEWTLDQEKLEAEAENSGILYSEYHKQGLGNRGHEDFSQNAREQLERLATPQNRVAGGSSGLETARLSDPPQTLRKIA